jgi:hypothetical protein
MLTVISYVVADLYTKIYQESVITFWWKGDFGRGLSINYFGSIIDLEVTVLNYMCEGEYLQPLIPMLDFYRVAGNNSRGIKIDFTPLKGYIMQ